VQVQIELQGSTTMHASRYRLVLISLISNSSITSRVDVVVVFQTDTALIAVADSRTHP